MPTTSSHDGCSINFLVEGPSNAPVLILSNSLGTSLHMWDGQAAAWSQRYRLIRYDHRGHGNSAAPVGPYSMDALGRDVLAVADTVGAAKFSFCGLSMGGMVGQWLGANARKRVEKLVLSNTNYHYGDKTPWVDRIKFAREKGMTELAVVQMQRWFTNEFRERCPDVVAMVSKMFVENDLDGFIGCCDAIREMDLRASTPTISAPTLIIVGSKDPATPPEHGHHINEMIKGSRLVTLDASHLSNIEQPQAYTEAVLDFLANQGNDLNVC